MALTRKMLKAMSIDDEKIDQIIEAHTETVDALKTERDDYKAKSEKLPALQKKIDDLTEVAKNGSNDTWKVKYDALKEDFDAYKDDQTAKEIKAAKSSAYKQLLKDIGISDKRLDSILKVSDLSNVELDEDGKIKNHEEMSKALKTEWSDFIITEAKKGANIPNPPGGTTPKTFTPEDIRKMSTAEINANYEAIKASLKNQ